MPKVARQSLDQSHERGLVDPATGEGDSFGVATHDVDDAPPPACIRFTAAKVATNTSRTARVDVVEIREV